MSLTCSGPGPGCNRLLCEYKGRSLNYGEAVVLQRKWDASRMSWTWEWSQKKRRFQPFFLFPSGAMETACLLDLALCPRKQREWEHLPQNCCEHRMRYSMGPWSPRKDVHVYRKTTLDKITFQYFNSIVFTTRRSTLPFLTSWQNGVLTEFEPLMEEYFSSSHTTHSETQGAPGWRCFPPLFSTCSGTGCGGTIWRRMLRAGEAEVGWNWPISLLLVD